MEEKKYTSNHDSPYGYQIDFTNESKVAYFVTLFTRNKQEYFGKLKYHVSQLSTDTTKFKDHDYLEKTEIGNTAANLWESIPEHNPFVKLDIYALMPNLIHGILILNNDYEETPLHNPFLPKRQNVVPPIVNSYFDNFDPLMELHYVDERLKNLSSVLRVYKGLIKTESVKKNRDFYWQPRFHKRVIKNQDEYDRIKSFILNTALNGDLEIDNIVPC